MNKNKKQFVIFAGGETAGPIMPLLALADAWHKEDNTIHPIFLDKKYSVAAHIVPKHGFEFKAMTSGKIRRYWTIKNFASPFLVLSALIRSIFLLITTKPIMVVGAGGYIQTPVIIAAWLLRIPRVIHQQDVMVTVTNKLCAPFANKITTAFEKSTKDFFQGTGFEKNYNKPSKITWTGNPCVIPNLTTKAEAHKIFNLENDWPTVLVIGGGSGAMGLNQALAHNLPSLLSATQIIHSTGRGKMIDPHFNSPELHNRYHQYEFIDRMDAAYAAADIVIARAGLGTITELSALQKNSIIVPLPNSHQELNAQYLYDEKAALIVDQSDITPDLLLKLVRKILFDSELQKQLQNNIAKIMPSNATGKVLSVIKSLIHE